LFSGIIFIDLEVGGERGRAVLFGNQQKSIYLVAIDDTYRVWVVFNSNMTIHT